MQPEIWIDANLPPSLAGLITEYYGLKAYSFLYLNFLREADLSVFNKARQKENVILMTKDHDFAHLIERLGPPPKVLWITIGNANNILLKEIIIKNLPQSISLLQTESLVEITN